MASNPNPFGYDLRDEEQVKEYLDNIEVEYTFHCFGEKSPDGCHRIGDYYEAIRPNIQKALQIYRMNCDTHNYGHSCYKLAKHMMIGKDIQSSTEEIFDYHNKGCQNGYSQSCHTSGLMYMDTKFVGDKKNVEKSIEYFKMGCDQNHAESCAALGEYYRKGLPNLPVDIDKCLQYHNKGCALNYLQSCVNLGVMYKSGIGVGKNEEKAQQYKDHAKKIYEIQYVSGKNLKMNQ